VTYVTTLNKRQQTADSTVSVLGQGVIFSLKQSYLDKNILFTNSENYVYCQPSVTVWNLAYWDIFFWLHSISRRYFYAWVTTAFVLLHSNEVAKYVKIHVLRTDF